MEPNINHLKKVLCAFLAAALLLLCVGCASGQGETSTSSEGSSGTASEVSEYSVDPHGTAWEETETPGVYRFTAEFDPGQVPEFEVHGGVILFKDVDAGMDTFCGTLKTVDLYTGETLGTFEFPDGSWIIRQYADGGFCILNQQTGVLDRYNKNAVKTYSTTIPADGFLSDLLLSEDGNKLLYIDSATGMPVLYDLTANRKTEFGGSRCIGLFSFYEDGFYYYSGDGELCRIGTDGSEQVVCECFEQSFHAPYLLQTTKKGYNFRKTNEEAYSFFAADAINEFAVGAKDGMLLCVNENVLKLYDLENKRASTIAFDGVCTAYCGFTERGEIYQTVLEDEKQVLYVLLPEELSFGEAIAIRPSEKADMEDPIVLTWKGTEAGVQACGRILDTYGVIVGYESEEFSEEIFWYQFTPASTERAEEYLLYVEEYLAMLPAGIMREICPGREPVIFLCDELTGDMKDFGDVAGFASSYARHPFVAVETCSSKDSFMETLAHELFHLLFEQNDDMVEALQEWEKMGPEDGYQWSYDISESKYTTYAGAEFEDIWFLIPYARTYPSEDRAVTGEYLFLSYQEEKMAGYFRNYPHIGEKAQMFCKMLHEHYEACRNETPYWEKVIKYTYKGE